MADHLTKRATILPHQLFGVKEHPTQDSSTESVLPIQVKPSPKLANTASLLQESTSHFDRFYMINQAGQGVFAVKGVRYLPPCVLKQCSGTKIADHQSVKPTRHKNIISLLEYANIENEQYLVYEYEHVALSLGCVVGRTHFSEADIATVCREVLQGLQYIHSELKISHGSIHVSNILLTSTGGVKIANIGDSMLEKRTLRDRDQDLKAVGSMIINLHDPTTLVAEDMEDDTEDDTISESTLSDCAIEFIESTKKNTITQLLKDDFMLLATPDEAWSLRPHYFAALPFGLRIGRRFQRGG